MSELVKKFLIKRKVVIVVCTSIAIFFLGLYAPMFPAIRDDAGSISELFTEDFSAVSEIFEIDSISFTKYELFLGAEYYSISWPIIMLFLAISLSSAAIVSEIENKSIYTMLSQPISRTNFFISRYISGTIGVTIFTTLSTLSAILVALPFDIKIDIAANFAVFLLSALFGMAMFSIGILISSFSSSKSSIMGILGGGFIIMYVFNIAANIQESVSFLKYFSLFHYFDTRLALESAELNLVSIIIFISIIIITSSLGLFIFNRRDI